MNSKTISYSFPDGRVYVGAIKNNRPNGIGTMTFPNGDVFEGSWIDGKKIGEVYFWNYTEATIVAVVGADGIAQQSPGPEFELHVGDKLLFVGKDKLTFDRVLSFLTYGVLEGNE